MLTAVGKLVGFGQEKDGNLFPVPGKPSSGRPTPSAQRGWASRRYKPTPLSRRRWSCRSGRGKERGFHCPGAQQAAQGTGGGLQVLSCSTSPGQDEPPRPWQAPHPKTGIKNRRDSLGDALQRWVSTVTQLPPEALPGRAQLGPRPWRGHWRTLCPAPASSPILVVPSPGQPQDEESPPCCAPGLW